jgi:hypothetical protein
MQPRQGRRGWLLWPVLSGEESAGSAGEESGLSVIEVLINITFYDAMCRE